MMLKAMREATIEGGLFQSNQMEVYQGMHDSQLALALSSQGGLGLAEGAGRGSGRRQVRRRAQRRDATASHPGIASTAYPAPAVIDRGPGRCCGRRHRAR